MALGFTKTFFIVYWYIVLLPGGAHSLIKPEYGIGFTQIGLLHPSCDRHQISLDFSLPKRKNYTIFNNFISCNLRGPGYRICMHFNVLFSERKKSFSKMDERINSKISDIYDILPTPSISKDRHKRFGFFSMFTGIVGFVNNLVLRKQMNILQSSVDTLIKNDFKLANNMQILHEDLSFLTQVTAENFIRLENDILDTNNRLSSVVREFSTIIRHIRNETFSLLNLEAELTTTAMSLLTQALQNYMDMFNHLDAFESGIIDLLAGKIPRTLVPPASLKKILDNAASELYDHLPTHNLLYKNLADYYSRTDLIYRLIDNHLIVVLPLMIRKRNQEPMSLYRIETSLVPYEISNKLNKDSDPKPYTEVVIEKPYLAILDKNFLELTSIQLSHCESNNKIWTCEQLLLQTHGSKITCSTAIFWNLEPDLIKEHCEFNYYHNINPPNQILQSDDKILMSGLSTPWSFNCHSKATPIRHQGSSYAITDIHSLCDCDIMGNDFFIPAKICPEHISNLELQYPINAAVYALLSETTSHPHILNFSELYKIPLELSIDKLIIEFEKEHDILVEPSRNEKTDLSRVAKLIKSHKSIYYDREDKQLQSSKFENWWTMDKIAIGITFILALLGTLAGIVAIISCVKTNRNAAFLGTILTQAKPATAMPLFCRRDASISDILPALLLQLMVSVSIFTIVRLLYKIYTRWSAVKIILPSIANKDTNLKSHLMLEIGDLSHVFYIYICSLPCCPSDVKMIGGLTYVTYTLKLRQLHGIIGIPWSETNTVITGYNIKMNMPEIAYVPPFKMLGIRNLIKRDNYTIRLLLNGNGFSHILTDNIEIKD